MVLVDTSVLIDLLRGTHNRQSYYLAKLEHGGISYSIPAVCAQEVLQGARDHKEYKLLRSYLVTQDLLVPKDPVTCHLEAARIYFDCRRRGETPRSTLDCFIAQLAIESDMELLHSDKDFERIGKVRKIRFTI